LDLINSPDATKIYLQIQEFLKTGLPYEAPPSIQVYNNMGVSFTKSGRFDQAKEAFEIGLKQVRNNLDSGEIRTRFSYHYMNTQGELTEECRTLLISLEQTMLYNLAYLEETRGRFREALRRYRGVLEKNPLMVEARLRIVRICDVLGRVIVKGNLKVGRR
jgi:tetratricopeptide (TPR) repeat protein